MVDVFLFSLSTIEVFLTSSTRLTKWYATQQRDWLQMQNIYNAIDSISIDAAALAKTGQGYWWEK